MIKFKMIGTLGLLVITFFGSQAQDNMTLQQAYSAAEENFPLLKSIDIYKAITAQDNALVDQSRKPLVQLKGETSLQSEAVSIGSDQPGSPINVDVPIYRAQAYGEVSYNLYDGGVSSVQKQINELNTLINEQEVLVNAYPLRAQVNQIFSGVALGKKLLGLYDITESDLQARKNLLESGLEYGTVLESDVTKLEVRILELNNDRRKVIADVNMAYATLSVLIGKSVSTDTELIIPSQDALFISEDLSRPELELFNRQRLAVKAQEEVIDVMDKPYITVFGQAGLSYPNNLNFSKVELAPFAIGGLSIGYKLFDKSDKSIKKQKLRLQSELVNVQEETFKHNLNIQSARYADEFDFLNDQINQFQRIADLQKEILNQLQVQLDNGVITSTDYLIQSNAELLARQNLEITRVKLIQKQLEYINIKGQNF